MSDDPLRGPLHLLRKAAPDGLPLFRYLGRSIA
jgi:hypothetical protein